MEHIGSRKIMVSQTRGPLGQDILKHLAEETRHACFFKRAAESWARRPLQFDETDAIRPASARMYFGRLDATIHDALGSNAHIEVPYPLRLADHRAARHLDLPPLPGSAEATAGRSVAEERAGGGRAAPRADDAPAAGARR